MVTVIVPFLSGLITNVEQFLEPGEFGNDHHKMMNLLFKPFGFFSHPNHKRRQHFSPFRITFLFFSVMVFHRSVLLRPRVKLHFFKIYMRVHILTMKRECIGLWSYFLAGYPNAFRM